MPLRAFPYPLRVGTDICHIPRIRAILTARIGDTEKKTRPLAQFLSKVLTWPERDYFWHRFDSPTKAYEDLDRVSRYLAGSAAASARPQGLILLERLAPYVQTGEPEEDWKDARPAGQRPFDVSQLDGQLCEISISHDDQFAQAVAIVPRMEDILDIESRDGEPVPVSGELSVEEVYNGY
ncbi:hypothetical protein K491DRAFT_608859 [Lophiostoma macrostomum CBS 122681]|uniref:4'-phosphopantetheinyl transferase domain-containing protein n=1 Tax=Lophiostoma macrostomum CBS 122681 TaxID=1314788 RepID=A0A6A6STL9_9PLEO|nr:hypothetical protein K491DRAFT_608859 [Lophiostoma macrostomum CBS 122681]